MQMTSLSFGREIKRRRLQAGMTQQVLAFRAEISDTTLRRIEGGEDATVNTLQRIAGALGCSVAALMVEEAA